MGEVEPGTQAAERESQRGGDPVTVAVTFSVMPGQNAAFERWAHEITVASQQFSGHLGASWLREGGTYHVVYRFASPALFNAWHESSERAGLLERLRPIGRVLTDESLTGMEGWFELPEQRGQPAPPRWKMVFVTWIGVFPLLALLQWLVAPELLGLPLVIRVMVLTLVVVFLMTYVVMPRLARVFRKWLYSAARGTGHPN
jgi:uncharacterized protein